MISWLNFWIVSLMVAGASFAVITAIVTVKGFEDLRVMFKGLKKQQVDSGGMSKEIPKDPLVAMVYGKSQKRDPADGQEGKS